MHGNAKPILVIGATGRHGNTGAHIVERLRGEGRAVRVLARTLSERTERLEELGAEVMVGDLHVVEASIVSFAFLFIARWLKV